jgi:hypothetical protein
MDRVLNRLHSKRPRSLFHEIFLTSPNVLPWTFTPYQMVKCNMFWHYPYLRTAPYLGKILNMDRWVEQTKHSEVPTSLLGIYRNGVYDMYINLVCKNEYVVG